MNMQKNTKPFRLDRISPSMIGSYLSCPLNFYYQYVAKIQLPYDKIHLIFGSAIHLALEKMLDVKDPNKVFIKAFDINKLNENERHLHKEYLALGKEMITNYMDMYPTLDKLYDLSTGTPEKRFRRHLTNPITGAESTIPLSGIVDKLTDTGIIIEYKTSKNKWKETETKFKVQNLLYNLWYYSEHGKLAEKMVYIILLKKFKRHKRDQVIQIIESQVTYDDLAEAFEEVELIIDKIHSGMFDKPTGYHPPYCDCIKYEKLLNTKK